MSSSKPRAARHGERGATLVESAIVVSVFFLIIFGIVDFGRAIYTYHMVDNAARLGARFAMVRGSTCSHTASPDPWPCPTPTDGSAVRSYVRQQSLLLGSGSVTVTTAWGDPSTGGANAGCTSTASPYNGPGCLVSVTVSYPFRFLLPLVPHATLSMSSTSRMVISQ